MSNILVHYDHTKACEEKFLLPYWVHKCCPPGGKGGWFAGDIRDLDLIPELERPPEVGNGNLLQ